MVVRTKQLFLFSPFSLRIAATVVFILVVLVLEGLNLLHSLLTSDDVIGTHDDVIGHKYRDGAVASEIAALIHYGTTVSWSPILGQPNAVVN